MIISLHALERAGHSSLAVTLSPSGHANGSGNSPPLTIGSVGYLLFGFCAVIILPLANAPFTCAEGARCIACWDAPAAGHARGAFGARDRRIGNEAADAGPNDGDELPR